MAKPSEGGPSLAEFATQNPQQSTGGCSACGLADRKEIDAFYREHGPAHVTIERWLRAKGVELTKSKLTYHYQRGHHQ